MPALCADPRQTPQQCDGLFVRRISPIRLQGVVVGSRRDQPEPSRLAPRTPVMLEKFVAGHPHQPLRRDLVGPAVPEPPDGGQERLLGEVLRRCGLSPQSR